MKKLLLSKLGRRGQALSAMLCLFLCTMPTLSAHAESYTLSVGESVSIGHATYMGGYISNVGLAETLDPHLSFQKDMTVGEAVITVNSYFDYTTTVKLVFLERYQSYYSGRLHNLIATYYKDVTIKCKYQAPDPSKMPTKVVLPERVRVPIETKVTISPVIEPIGATVTSHSWSYERGTSYFRLLNVENSIDCTVRGWALGIGRATIMINDDENLQATTIIEVVDPNNLPPTNFFLPDTVEVSIGGQHTISPILVPEGSATSFTWESGNPSIAIVEAGKVTGLKEGEAMIIANSANQLTDTCIVKVVQQNGKDDDTDTPALMGVIDGYEYVDLGLGVLWAAYDVGASRPDEKGDLFSWSETSPKSSYTESNYKGNTRRANIDIKGTNEDAAYVNWGSNWRMPTSNEYLEMFSKCSFSEEDNKYNEAIGCWANGTNGAGIFFVNSRYWTSNGTEAYSTTAAGAKEAMISGDSQGRQILTINRCLGLNIRAVSSADPVLSGKKPTSIALGQNISMKEGEVFMPKYTITPADATTTLKWTSENPLVVSASATGVVTAVGVGTTKIRIETCNGLTASFEVTVEGLTDVAQPIGGAFTSYFIDKAGTLWGGGRNSYGNLNNGSTKSSIKPIWVMDDVTSVVSGNAYSSFYLIAKKDGTVSVCGSNLYGQLGTGNRNSSDAFSRANINDVTSVSSGQYFSFFIKKDGSLWACGDNSYGVFGNGTNNGYNSSPKQVLDNVQSASGGFSHSLIVKNDGTLWASGRNSYGQLGDGTKEDKNTFVKVMDNVRSASAGRYHSLVVKNDGSLWTFGYNKFGQLGDGTTEDKATPVKVMDDVLTASSYSSARHTLILKNDGTLWGCGENSRGQINSDTTQNYSTPVLIMRGVANMSAGDDYTLIVKKNGSVWACGYNEWGKLCIGSADKYSIVPAKVVNGNSEPREVSTSASGYATFYDSADDYQLPDGLKASVVTEATNKKIVYKDIEGDVVPAGTAVMLTNSNMTSATFTLNPSYSGATYTGTNLLRGSDESTTTTGDGYHYKLSYGQTGSAQSSVFGWYWGARDGGAFSIEGHKAWLVVPKSNATRAFSADGDALAIEHSPFTIDHDDDAPLYDLQGRRVDGAVKKGVYIRNGQKVIVK